MKKVAIVLLMGLAIGMTFMSCSKEEDCAVCFEDSGRKIVLDKIQSTRTDVHLHLLDTGVKSVYYAG